ncbi:stress protein [Rothia uropygioeca]|uniref:stress protein n=1 Tax=Kocuria sp. 257 TaxID=2021970 RepID=UPI001012FAD6|nr:stress protein [Kocuria sp. 257]
MADKNNPGQFGNREDTAEQAHRGGEQSTGSFGDKNAADPREAGRESTGSFGEKNSADPHEAGKEGAEAQSTEDKAKGGVIEANSPLSIPS